jgi:uridylate kinase
MSASLRTRMSLLAALELIVGGIVVLGGAALVYFSTDTTGSLLAWFTRFSDYWPFQQATCS